jgi:hypothetical protein
MPDRSHHCPFLNRADARCSKHFSIDALGYAFDHCFDYYEGCGVYLELLVERRVRRARGHDFDGAAADAYAHQAPFVQLTVAGRRHANDQDRAHAAVAGGYAFRAADPSLVSHAPGL